VNASPDGRWSPRWADLLAFDDTAAGDWLPSDYPAMWQHQLESPLEFEWGPDRAGGPDAASALPPLPGGCRTYGELLHGSASSIEWLSLVKDFAKAHLVSKVECLPRDLARGLYYSTIACALVRHGQSISRLERSELVTGFGWMIDQPWLDPATRELMVQGLGRLGEQRGA